ncbi:hypothetical protein E6H25_04000 [Candidatus Bathyarchaeota archaeon]|nr:MAG: hypothetical protein E6H25_04000 [Candidatus Bathyarchaeota archaeon]
MNPKKYLNDRKGIQTILAALLMVVIVVVAAVMVYAWSTGLLGTLLATPPPREGPLAADSFAFANSTAVTIYIRNSGTGNVTLAAYYVTDSSGNTWQLLSWSGPTIAPNTAKATNIPISTSCPSCQYTGTGSGYTFTAGYSYTVKVLTARNNPFTFTVTK